MCVRRVCESGKPRQDSCEFLLLLCHSRMGIVDPLAAVSIEINWLVPSTGNWSWTSRYGGLSQRLKWQGHRQIPLPTVILANVRLLHNKVDELQGNVTFLTEYRNACLLALMEIWLGARLTVRCWYQWIWSSFLPIQKLYMRPSCLCVSGKLCNKVAVREKLCTKNLKLYALERGEHIHWFVAKHFLTTSCGQLWSPTLYIFHNMHNTLH